ncbi:hypothetical protein EVG20_g8644 [Dentipellis fragilis]|uniref:Uncharacterized protein n=1 Tax=Dentipellis fragilis TaxID=205917 RepID=A0A4Y9Y487_9AGAM|nr:hypothetical protein EVG20_g8644 [Dentipellis fragilis]
MNRKSQPPLRFRRLAAARLPKPHQHISHTPTKTPAKGKEREKGFAPLLLTHKALRRALPILKHILAHALALA